MINITLEELLKITDGTSVHPSIKHCESFEIDSRRVNKNTYFMPILGEIHDGHKFILGALNNGAPTSFCEKAYYYSHQDSLKDQPLILVDNTTTALHKITKHILAVTGVKTIGITGSVGKTSTKEFVYHVLKRNFNVHKNKGNFNNHIGLPLTVMDIEPKHDLAILEMGMNHFKEIEVLADIARPSIAVITNIGTSHIGILGSQQNIFQAKMEIASYLEEDDTLILNGEDVFLREISCASFNLVQVANKQLKYTNETQRPDGCFDYNLHIENDSYKVSLNVLGKHNIMNSLLSISVGLTLGVSIENAIKGVKEYQDSSKRLELIAGIKNSRIINDCYNASQESMISAIEVLTSFEGKKIAVLGDVLELGDFSKESHEAVGDYIFDKEIDCLITFGQASQHIGLKAARMGFDKKRIVHFEEIEALLTYLDDVVMNSVCLIKGSLGMNMSRIVDAFSTDIKGGNIDIN